LAATGGHNDYAGNEVTAIELADANPAWRLLAAGSAADKVAPDVAYYQDGLPTSRHTYDSVHFSTTRNRLILHGSRFVYGRAVSFGASNGFNLDTLRWDAAGTWRDGGGVVCRDERDYVWAASRYYYMNRWDPATDTWTQTGYFPFGIFGPLAHDTTRDQLFQLAWGDGQGSNSGVNAYKYNAHGSTQTPVTFNASAALSQFRADMPAYASMIYDPNGDRFLFWDGMSGRLYQVKPNAGAGWDISILVTTGRTPPQTSGSYGRMAYLPALRGCVFMPSGHESLYFIRLA